MPLQTCTCARIRRAARVLTRIYDDALAPTGLTTAQFSLLRTLERLGPVSISALAEATGHERSTLGRNLRLLEQAGHVALGGGRDQRARIVSLSAGGSAALLRAEPLWTEVEARVEAELGGERRRALVALLDEVEALGAGAPGAPEERAT
jgi:DNA-binding MarR family transcriptional regulator